MITEGALHPLLPEQAVKSPGPNFYTYYNMEIFLPKDIFMILKIC